jgi:hypothetical protein
MSNANAGPIVSGGAGHHFSMSGISLVVKYASTGVGSDCAFTLTAAIMRAAIINSFFIVDKLLN